MALWKQGKHVLVCNILFVPSRQLEAIIRISEALAKMRLLPFATAAHVEEALRLFQVSTLDAAMSGSLSGIYKIIFFKIAGICQSQGSNFKMTIVGNSESFHVTIGAEDFTPEQDVEEVRQIEKQIKRRFAIGTQVSQNRRVVCNPLATKGVSL